MSHDNMIHSTLSQEPDTFRGRGHETGVIQVRGKDSVRHIFWAKLKQKHEDILFFFVFFSSRTYGTSLLDMGEKPRLIDCLLAPGFDKQ